LIWGSAPSIDWQNTTAGLSFEIRRDKAVRPGPLGNAHAIGALQAASNHVIPASAERVSGTPTARSTWRWIPALRFAWRE
jgi:hypothetical protein